MRKLALLALLMVVPLASAQRMGGGHMHFGSRAGAYGGYAYPFLDPLFGDTFYPNASQPTVIVVPQASVPVAADPVPVAVPAEPLLIELQGDRYVRVGGQNSSENAAGMRGPGPDLAARSADSVQRTSPAPHVATVLVFRDGHREEVSEYTIAQGVLYANANFYASGSWLRKIDLTTLNVSETMAANQSRNVRFALPSSPNEIIVAP